MLVDSAASLMNVTYGEGYVSVCDSSPSSWLCKYIPCSIFQAMLDCQKKRTFFFLSSSRHSKRAIKNNTKINQFTFRMWKEVWGGGIFPLAPNTSRSITTTDRSGRNTVTTEQRSNVVGTFRNWLHCEALVQVKGWSKKGKWLYGGPMQKEPPPASKACQAWSCKSVSLMEHATGVHGP